MRGGGWFLRGKGGKKGKGRLSKQALHHLLDGGEGEEEGAVGFEGVLG